MPAAVVAIGAAVAGSGAASAAVSLSAGLIAAGGFAASAISSVVAFGVQTLGNSLLGVGERERGSAQAQELARGLLVNTASTVEPIPIIYGARRIGGSRVFGPEVSGSSNEFINLVIVWSEGPIDDVVQHYLDDRAIDDPFWQTSRYANPANVVQVVHEHVGTDAQSADATLIAQAPGKWTSAHRLRGVAYSYLNLGWDPDKFSGLPIISADVRGRLVFDPRDQSTGWSDNPALVVRDYLTNTRYGRGLPASAIDDDSIIEAANYCDQLIEVPNGAGGTTTQKRYTANGRVDVDRTPLDNVSELLSACRGMLIFTAGLYRLRIDRPETAGFAFTEDNIVGAWQVSLGDKRTVANRVRARFFNENRRWQPDMVVVDSPTLRTADNGLVLEREITLPFTSDRYRAEQIAQMELRQSRQHLTATFTATLEATRVEVGDVVTITHTTPGWSAKEFRVLRLRLLGNDEVEVVAREYDASVYDLDALDDEQTSPDTDLPDALSVAAPGVPQVDESLYVTRDGAGVRAKADVSWEASPDAFVSEYQLEFRIKGTTSWTIAGRTPQTSTEVLDVAPAIYEWRVKALNNLGVSSAYAQTQAEILGLQAAPTEPQNLTIQAAGGIAILRWDRSADLDVRVGGRIEFRHSPAQTGATWVASATIGNAVGGDQTITTLPLKPGTYLAKAVDAAGVRSTVAATASTKAASLLAFSTLSTVSEHSTFSGTHDGTVALDGVLKLDSGGDVDSWADVDSIANWDVEGGVLDSGTYTFATGMDLGAVKRVRLRTVLGATQVQALELFDDRAELVDDWEDWDGDSAGAVADAQVWVRETDDDPAGTPAWSAWQRLESGEFEARAFEFQARLSTDDVAYNVEVDELSVTAEEVI